MPDFDILIEGVQATVHENISLGEIKMYLLIYP